MYKPLVGVGGGGVGGRKEGIMFKVILSQRGSVCSVPLNDFPLVSSCALYKFRRRERRDGRGGGGVMEKISKLGPVDTCQI